MCDFAIANGELRDALEIKEKGKYFLRDNSDKETNPTKFSVFNRNDPYSTFSFGVHGPIGKNNYFIVYKFHTGDFEEIVHSLEEGSKMAYGLAINYIKEQGETRFEYCMGQSNEGELISLIE